MKVDTDGENSNLDNEQPIEFIAVTLRATMFDDLAAKYVPDCLSSC